MLNKGRCMNEENLPFCMLRTRAVDSASEPDLGGRVAEDLCSTSLNKLVPKQVTVYSRVVSVVEVLLEECPKMLGGNGFISYCKTMFPAEALLVRARRYENIDNSLHFVVSGCSVLFLICFYLEKVVLCKWV